MMNPQYPGNQGQMPPTGYGMRPPGPGHLPGQMPPQPIFNGTSQQVISGQQMGAPKHGQFTPIGGVQNGPQSNFHGPSGPQGDIQFGGNRGPVPPGINKPPQHSGQFQHPTSNVPNSMNPPTSTHTMPGSAPNSLQGSGLTPNSMFEQSGNVTLSSMGSVAPPNSMIGHGLPPNSMMGHRAPPSSMGSGAPPNSMMGSGALPNSLMSSGAPPNSLMGSGAPPNSMMGSGAPSNPAMGPSNPPNSVGSGMPPPNQNMRLGGSVPLPGGQMRPSYSGQAGPNQSQNLSSQMGGMSISGGPPRPINESMSGPQNRGPPPSQFHPMGGQSQAPPTSMPPTGGATPVGMGPPTSMGQYSQNTAMQPGAPSGFPPLPGKGPAQGGFPPLSGPPMPGGVPPTSQFSQQGGMPPQSMSQPFSNAGHFPPPQKDSGQYSGGSMPGQGGYPQQFPGPGTQKMGPSGGLQQPSQRKLDPDQMPSPIQVIEDDINNRSGLFTTGERGVVPPLVTTPFTVQDQGNCSPRFLRSTMYNIPCTSDMMKNSHIPFALNIAPFAKISDQEGQPPIVNLGEIGPVRCKRCKAYMNPYMMFIDGGRRFQCVYCGAQTDVPAEYFAHLDHTGRRVDCYDRPELCLGSYEFVATKDYCKNSKLPSEPAFIFMIDVSYNSVKSGLANLICERLKDDILVNLPKDVGAEESEIRVGFVTYAKEIHFYNVKGNLAQPQMLVVSDLEDVFVPLLDGFLVKLSESEAVIDSLLAQIPQMFCESRETETVLGPVIQAGLDALKSADRSGKLYLFHTSLPIAEAPGKLKNRDDRKLLGTEKEKTILTTQNNFYNKLGQDCVASGCSVDIFLFPNSYVDVASISDVCRLTGGTLYKYSYFQADLDGERFLQDLKRNIESQAAFDAILRVRTSTGIRPVDFYGNFYMANTTDVELAAMDSGQAINVEIKHDDKLNESDGAYVQVAVLYTSVGGQRRLRIHNIAFNCCTQMADLFRNCELDCLINYMAKQAIRTTLNTNPRQVRENIMSQVAQILACYRKNCASPSSAGQLILPECMKLLPLYSNCILKSDGLQGGSEISTDDRSYLMHLMGSMDVKFSHSFFYPRLFPLHNLDVESTKLPRALRCSAERLQDNGVYLLENGISMFMWIGHNVEPKWIQEVFGVQSAAQVDIDKCKLLTLDNELSHRVRDIVQQIRKEKSRYMKLTIVRQRDKLEPWFNHFLVEDKGLNNSASYVDFLCHIHVEIRNLLS